jgi:hypothetical protein
VSVKPTEKAVETVVTCAASSRIGRSRVMSELDLDDDLAVDVPPGVQIQMAVVLRAKQETLA